MKRFGKAAIGAVLAALAALFLAVAGSSAEVSVQEAAQDAVSNSVQAPNAEEWTVLVDDFEPQPMQWQDYWPHNRLGGDRGRIDGPGGGTVEWGLGVVTATITGGNDTWMGVWTSLNHPLADCTPLDFSAILPSALEPQYQGSVSALRFHVLDGQGEFRVELQIGENTYCPPQVPVPAWPGGSAALDGGGQVITFAMPPDVGQVQNLNWLVWGDAGDFVVVDRVEMAVSLANVDTDAERAFLHSYAMLLGNWDPVSGLTRDSDRWAAGGFDNVSASGMQAAAAVMAWRLGFISEASATDIVEGTTAALLALPRDECGGSLWPHFVEDGQIVSDTEWSSIDTVIAAVALIEARQALSLDTGDVEAVLTGIGWDNLILTDGHISHGYWSDCQPIEPGGTGGWQDFGTESWLVNFAYAAASGNVADFDHTPPTYNGSGFIDELAWLLLPAPSRDRWGMAWDAYRQQAADTQLAYYQAHPCYGGPPRLFGLSAAEVPDPSLTTSTYEAFGVGGEIPANDGTATMGHAVVIPHYAGLAASLLPTEAAAYWQWLEQPGPFTPLNNVESLMFVDEPACAQVTWNALKGSWNLSLQTLGWGRLLAGEEHPLYAAMWSNDRLARGYWVMVDTILITGVHFHGYADQQPDEAFRLMNVSDSPVDLGNWTVTDGEGTITLQDTLAPGASLWIARGALAFADEFGFAPDYEYDPDIDDPTVPNLPQDSTFVLADGGDEVVLKDDVGVLVDSVVYKGGDPTGTGWSGTPVEPYGPTSAFAKEGQVLYRMLDQATGLPGSDTGMASDWAQATDDNINGKKVMYPGWDLEEFFFPETFTETATLTYTVAPDSIYETVLAEINKATSSIYYEGYTFKNAHLADAIVARMQANPGMTVTLLLEGEPVGGVINQEKWICQQIENAGGQVHFMYNDEAGGVHDRYKYQHGKWMVVDEEYLLTGSENLNYSSMPADDKSDGTEGNRGVWLITDAPSAVAHALDVFQHDMDPGNHKDLFRWTASHPTYGAPPPTYTAVYSSGGTFYPIQFPDPLTINGTFSFEIVKSPETSLRDSDSLLGMVARAGAGDTVLVEQLYEYAFWGPTSSNPTDDPNLRLEAYIAAARRGAKVRILLDSTWDDPEDERDNSATCAYVEGIAAAEEGLDLACKMADPTGNGIHNKMVLVSAGGRGYVHTGSINGSEVSSKTNREFAVQVQSDGAYSYLADVFWYDWGRAISDLAVTDVTSTTATISWRTDPPAESWVELDSALYPVFPNPRPVEEALQGVAYAPGEYNAHLSWVPRDSLTDTITGDVEAIARANFNAIVLYPSAESGDAVHPLDRIALDAAVAQGLAIGFRLEWYEPAWFDWEPQDCEAILDRYDAYFSYFEAHPDLLAYLLIHMPLDDPLLADPDPAMATQRGYMETCYDAVKSRFPGEAVYANTYYGYKDELDQAPVADLVDGLSIVTYAQHSDEAPFDCHLIPTGADPAATLICKDQFDYYLDKSWVENDVASLAKPFVLDATGFAPAASYDVVTQRNGIVLDSWAKVRAITTLRRYLEHDARLYGWSYFKLLHKSEADWGLIDRRKIDDDGVATDHELLLTDLFPGTAYTVTVRAAGAPPEIVSFTTDPPPPEANHPPFLTVQRAAYGHQLVPPEGELALTWWDYDPDDDAAIGLYFDPNDAGCDGTLIVDALSEDSTTQPYTWTLPALPTGSYYVYGQIDDGTNPVECDYSPGRIVPSIVTLRVLSRTGAIAVDGHLDEPAWEYAVPLIYAVHSAQTDVTTATVRSLWDADYLYLAFDVEDGQVETSEGEWDGDGVSLVFNNGEYRCRQTVGGTGEGDCDRVLYLPPCTTLDNPADTDCGYTVEMRIRWSRARITANAGDIVPTDLLSVDHDGNPGAPWNDPDTRFSKLSWDGDSNVETTGRSLTLAPQRWSILLPLVMRGYTMPTPPGADLTIHDLIYEGSDEQIIIRNRGTAPQDMTGWKIHSVVGGQEYTFPSGYTLGAGASVHVHSGEGALEDPPTHLLWRTGYVWSNSGDKAVLYDAGGLPVDSYCYGAGCP